MHTEKTGVSGFFISSLPQNTKFALTSHTKESREFNIRIHSSVYANKLSRARLIVVYAFTLEISVI